MDVKEFIAFLDFIWPIIGRYPTFPELRHYLRTRKVQIGFKVYRFNGKTFA